MFNIRPASGASVHVAQVLVYMHQNMNPFEVRVGDEEEEVWAANPVCGRYLDMYNLGYIQCFVTGDIT